MYLICDRLLQSSIAADGMMLHLHQHEETHSPQTGKHILSNIIINISITQFSHAAIMVDIYLFVFDIFILFVFLLCCYYNIIFIILFTNLAYYYIIIIYCYCIIN